MNFKEALSYLNLEDYSERIFNSNIRGELFHLQDYIVLAEYFKENEDCLNVENVRDIFTGYLKEGETDIVMQYLPTFINQDAETQVWLFKITKDFMNGKSFANALIKD